MRFRRDRIPPGFVLLASGFGYDTGGGLFAVREDGVERLTGLARRDWRWRVGSSSGCFARPGAGLRERTARLRRARRRPTSGSRTSTTRTTSIGTAAASSSYRRRGTQSLGLPLRGNRPKLDGTGPRRCLAHQQPDNREGAPANRGVRRLHAPSQWVDQDPSRTRVRLRCRDGRTHRLRPHLPHHRACSTEGGWFATRATTSSSSRGSVKRRLELRGWTRGSPLPIATSSWAARPATGPQRRASGSLGNPRRRWRVADRIVCRARIYDLLLVPEALAGRSTSHLRQSAPASPSRHSGTSLPAGVQPQALGERRAATGRGHPGRDHRKLPEVLPRGTMQRAECTVTTGFDHSRLSAAGQVNLSYRWLEGPPGAPLTEGLRSPLPRPLPPEGAAECRLALEVPAVSGGYTIRVTLVQEQVRWFDEVDSRNGWTVRVRVG